MLLKVPPPDVIDHAPVVAPPPTLAPLNVIADGVADWQTLSGPPGVTVGAVFTLIVLVALTAEQAPGALVVRVKVTVPVKFAAGVYVTVEGVVVCKVLLNVPPPDVIDHAPVVAPPPTLDPLKVIADGEAD